MKKIRKHICRLMVCCFLLAAGAFLTGFEAEAKSGKWKKDSRGWRYVDTTGWYAKSATYVIDGIKCRFDAKGYLIED